VQDEQVRLYPGVAPGSEGCTYDELELIDPTTGERHFHNVVVPTITPMLPPSGQRVGSAVVVAPGGGFGGLVWDHEGVAMARWLNERGVVAFVLKYRLAHLPADAGERATKLRSMPRPGTPEFGAWLAEMIGDAPDLAAADGEQAIRLIRSDACRWAIDPNRIGILGFSAGATIALRTAATTDSQARPAFVVDVYGSFLGRDVPVGAPPLLAIVAADDALCRSMVLDAVDQWLSAGAPAELHLYESGGHGFGLKTQGAPTDDWLNRLHAWLEAHGVLAADESS
jgi:acetyl esterase/lipase